MSAIAGQMMSAVAGQVMDIQAEKRADARQKRAEDRSKQRERDMAHMYDQYARDKFEYTGYGAQAQQLRDAGMNIGLMYGSAGQGGQSSATTASNTQSTPSVQNNAGTYMGVGIQGALAEAQLESIKAQTNKTNAEAENITGGVRDNLTEDSRSKKFNNDINERYKDLIEEARTVEWDTTKIRGEEANAAWEFKKAIEYGQKPETEGGAFTNENSRVARARIAEMQGYEEDLKKAKINNDIAEAEKIIKEFEAEMTKQGISPNSPWYAKLVTDLLNKVGLLDLIGIGQGAVKKEVKQITK